MKFMVIFMVIAHVWRLAVVMGCNISYSDSRAYVPRDEPDSRVRYRKRGGGGANDLTGEKARQTQWLQPISARGAMEVSPYSCITLSKPRTA